MFEQDPTCSANPCKGELDLGIIFQNWSKQLTKSILKEIEKYFTLKGNSITGVTVSGKNAH